MFIFFLRLATSGSLMIARRSSSVLLGTRSQPNHRDAVEMPCVRYSKAYVIVTASLASRATRSRVVKVSESRSSFLLSKSLFSRFQDANYRRFLIEQLLSADVNECKKKSNVCGRNSVCKNSMGSYKCICEKGYKPHRGENGFTCIS